MRLIVWRVAQPKNCGVLLVIGAVCFALITVTWSSFPLVWPAISVGIDAGHGGKDPGAIGHNGLKEKTVTLAVAQRVNQLLREQGDEAVLTRSSDTRLAGSQRSDLRARVRVAHHKDVDVLVSIHCNAFRLSTVRGPRTYYQPGSKDGRLLAAYIQHELRNVIGYGRQEPTPENHFITRESNMTAVIVELGYITNYGEERLLTQDWFRIQLAQAVAAGIRRYAQETGL